MLYKIVLITDLDGNPKTDESAQGRIGRVIDLDKDEIEYDRVLFMKCAYPGFHKSLLTSFVKNVTEANDGLIITTENSIYFLVDIDIAEQYENERMEH